MRAISIDGFNKIPKPADVEPAPQLQWIKIADLVVDGSYQRPLDTSSSRNNIRAIAERFDWRRFAPVIVSPVEGGRFAIIDGQHRCTGAALVGIEVVPCNVVLADRREQATAFEAINGNVTRVSRHQIFKARLAAGEASAARIDAVARAAGVRILHSNRSSNMRAPQETLALNCLTKLIEAHGDKVVTRALRSIVLCAGDQTGYLTAIIITAVVEVLADHKEWQRHSAFELAIANIDLLDAKEKAHMRAIAHKGTTTLDNLQAEIVETLTKALGRAAA